MTDTIKGKHWETNTINSEELVRVIEDASDYVMIKVAGKGFTIITWAKGGPNIGEWGCNNGGETFRSPRELVSTFKFDGKTIEESIDITEVLEYE